MSDLTDNKYALYLRDLGSLVKEYALAAKSDYAKSMGTANETYQSGYLMGFHRFVTLMQQQAEAFQIPLNEINLHNIDENDFL